jgi:hypothetical protein
MRDPGHLDKDPAGSFRGQGHAERQSNDDGTVTRCGVSLRPCLMACEKNFADAAVFEPRDRRAVTESAYFEVERLGRAPVWQALARGNGEGGCHATRLRFFRMGEAVARLFGRAHNARAGARPVATMPSASH